MRIQCRAVDCARGAEPTHHSYTHICRADDATATESLASASASASPFADVPFAFPADSVVGFYEGEGMSCAAPVPSTKAAGWMVTTCQGTDTAGRPNVVGVVTDPAGRLGNGFASVTALPDADLLEPTDALEMLSGFLGAMVGDAAATELLPWLASHLGDEYATTTFGGGTIATYRISGRPNSYLRRGRRPHLPGGAGTVSAGGRSFPPISYGLASGRAHVT